MLFTLFHPFSNFHKKFMQCNMQYSVCIELKNSLKSIYKICGEESQPQGSTGAVGQTGIHHLRRNHEEVPQNTKVSFEPCGLSDK